MTIKQRFLSSASHGGDGGADGLWMVHGHLVNPQSLPYYVELCRTDAGAGEVIAIAKNPAIAYASYYAAIQSYPDDLVVLRLNNRVLARSMLRPKPSGPA